MQYESRIQLSIPTHVEVSWDRDRREFTMVVPAPDMSGRLEAIDHVVGELLDDTDLFNPQEHRFVVKKVRAFVKAECDAQFVRGLIK